MKIVAFLPIRNPSERVHEKNTRDFAGIRGGLTAIKVEQLCRVKPAFELIVVSTNEQEIREIVTEKASEYDASVCIIKEDRTPGWGTDELICHAARCFSHHPGDTAVLWTHVTSPFFDEDDYSSAFTTYEGSLSGGCDSLMSARQISPYVVKDGYGPMWEQGRFLWPRTQDLDKVYEIDGACFIAPLKIYREDRNRIGDNPYFYKTDYIKAIDIDWPVDFEFAEQIWRMHHG